MSADHQHFAVTKIRPEHVSELKALLYRVWYLSYITALGQSLIDQLTSELHTIEKLTAELHNTQKASLGVFQTGTLIGDALTVRQPPETNYIGRLYVDPSYQRIGVGQALLNAAETAFDCRVATLEVFHSSNNAVRFYRRNGYVQIGRHRSAHAVPTELFDLQFSKTL